MRLFVYANRAKTSGWFVLAVLSINRGRVMRPAAALGEEEVSTLTLGAGARRGRIPPCSGHDRFRPVARPEIVDHRRHQAQHLARALEAFERRPVVVEPLEHLRVDRIARLQALRAARLPALRCAAAAWS